MPFVSGSRRLFAVLLLAVSAFAADVTGSWNLVVETPNGPRQSTVDFRQDGNNVTGTVHNRTGDAPLTGSVNGDQISFSVTRDRDGQSFTIEYSAKVDGSKMAGTLKFGDNGGIPFSATRK